MSASSHGQLVPVGGVARGFVPLFHLPVFSNPGAGEEDGVLAHFSVDQVHGLHQLNGFFIGHLIREQRVLLGRCR